MARRRREWAGVGQTEAECIREMARRWVTVRDGARDQTLKPGDSAVLEIAERWEQFIEATSLELRQTLGRPVTPIWPKSIDRQSRIAAAARRLAQDGLMAASIKVPDAAAPLVVEANLRTRQLIASAEFAAPNEGRAKGRIGWLLRQAKDMPASMRIEARYPNVREPVVMRLGEALERPDRMLCAPDAKRDPRSFRLVLADDLGKGRGRGRGTFVGDSRSQILAFYRDVLQQIRPWQAPAPRLPAQLPVTSQAEDVPVGVTIPQGPDTQPS